MAQAHAAGAPDVHIPLQRMMAGPLDGYALLQVYEESMGLLPIPPLRLRLPQLGFVMPAGLDPQAVVSAPMRNIGQGQSETHDLVYALEAECYVGQHLNPVEDQIQGVDTLHSSTHGLAAGPVQHSAQSADQGTAHAQFETLSHARDVDPVSFRHGRSARPARWSAPPRLQPSQTPQFEADTPVHGTVPCGTLNLRRLQAAAHGQKNGNALPIILHAPRPQPPRIRFNLIPSENVVRGQPQLGKGSYPHPSRHAGMRWLIPEKGLVHAASSTLASDSAHVSSAAGSSTTTIQHTAPPTTAPTATIGPFAGPLSALDALATVASAAVPAPLAPPCRRPGPPRLLPAPAARVIAPATPPSLVGAARRRARVQISLLATDLGQRRLFRHVPGGRAGGADGGQGGRGNGGAGAVHHNEVTAAEALRVRVSVEDEIFRHVMQETQTPRTRAQAQAPRGQGRGRSRARTIVRRPSLGREVVHDESVDLLSPRSRGPGSRQVVDLTEEADDSHADDETDDGVFRHVLW